MRKIIGLAIVLSLLAGCVWRLSPDSQGQDEQISISYHDESDTRTAEAISSSGERFIGTIIWAKDPNSSARYRGSLIGNMGRTLSVELECSTSTAKCVGSAKANTGDIFNIF